MLATLLIATSIAVMSPLTDPPSIDLEGVPATLSIPLPPGENIILSATISGASVERIWLAPLSRPDRGPALTLTPSGQYRINLGDPEVTTSLLAADANGFFRVHAQVDGGRVISSVSVGYRTAIAKPHWTLTLDDGDRARLEGPVHWADPSRVAALHARITSIDSTVRARLGDQRFPFAADADGLGLDVSDALRREWRRHGALHLETRELGAWTPVLRLEAIPLKLDFAGSSVLFNVHQRRTADLPGSRGYLQLSLGDITRGQVLLSLRTPERWIHRNLSLRPRGSVRFELESESYELTVERLANLIVGRDWAEISISRMESDVNAEIQGLIRRVEDSGFVFIREGRRYPARRAAEHLRRKLAAHPEPMTSVEEFIEKIARRSSLTGRPYRIEFEDGTSSDFGTWLEGPEEASAPKKARD